MFNNLQFREAVLRPALKDIDMYSLEAEELLVGTMAHESKGGTYLVQLNNGPAKGLFQMEPSTHDDIWNNFIKYKLALKSKILLSLGSNISDSSIYPNSDMLIYNLKYACIMCRLDYDRARYNLPHKDDLIGQANYWKLHYNSKLGKGTVDEYISDYKAFIKPSI